MVRFAFFAVSSPILLSCSSPAELDDRLSGIEAESAQETLERRIAADAEAVEFSDEASDGEAARDFSYSWPAQVSAIPAFAQLLEQRRYQALAEQKSEWEQSIEEFGTESCITCVNRSYSNSWEVAADTPRFLVMRAETFTYTGGAHGNSHFDAIVWDRQANDGAGETVEPIELFVDPVALENTAYGDYCQSLLEARRDKLEITIDGMNKFEDCPSVAELVVVPLSSEGRKFDRVNFLAAPYVAGSFAEGPYEFSIAVTPAILEVVKPEYREEFIAGE